MNKVRFPVGDWSDDGHGNCDYYFATTNKTTQDIREAHFKCNEIYGFDIGNKIDSELKLSPVIEEYEDINFYGRDNKLRHLNTLGMVYFRLI